MDYLIFVGYLILFAWLVTKTKFFTRSGLNPSQLVIVFLLKVMAGIFYGWIGVYYGNLAKMVDTWFYHYNSLQELALLKNHPHEYFTNLFTSTYKNGFTHFFNSHDSWWSDLKGNFFIKILSIFNIFSFGSYYVNVIFYSFLSMFGPIAIFRVMANAYPGKKIQVMLATFLVPSFIYWTSGIHKEGLIFVGLALVTYHVYFGLQQGHFTAKRIISIICAALLVLALRNFLIVLLAPAVIVWILASRWPRYGWQIFAGSYLFFGILFFTAKYLYPPLDFPAAVVEKQQEFLTLTGGSAVPIHLLEPTFSGFVQNFPQAVNLAMIRPYPSDVNHILSLAAAVEIVLLMLLFAIFILFREKGVRSKLLIYFCVFFSFTLLLSIGYTVHFLGAIVRYRSLAFPFLLIPLICQINWKKISHLFPSNNINKKNNLIKSGY